MSEIKYGSIVHVSNSAVEAGRSFDFGEVTNVNADGTFAVLWSKAGCACMGMPNENADQLTLSTHNAYDAFYESSTLPEGINAEAVKASTPAPSLSSFDDEDDYDDYEEDEDYDEEDEEDESAKVVDPDEAAKVATVDSGHISLSPTNETQDWAIAQEREYSSL